MPRPFSTFITSGSLPGADNGITPFAVTIGDTEVIFTPHYPIVYAGIVTWFGTIDRAFSSGGFAWPSGARVVLRLQIAYALVGDNGQPWEMEVMLKAVNGFAIGMTFAGC